MQGKYKTVRKIADGGTAEIFLARMEGEQGFQKAVVLKYIRPTFSRDPHFRNLLIDEAHVAMGLNHSNIVQVLDLGESAGQYFLVLELVDGWSLDQILKRAEAARVSFPPSLALYVVVQTCRALAYAHSAQREGRPLEIVHRDISPQNILVSERGEVKLTDFGIAKAQSNAAETMRGVVKGKVSFMSPEQTQAAAIDQRSDLFSLGTLLYYMATQQLPFRSGTPIEIMGRIQAGIFESPAKVSPKLQPDLIALILKAMRTKPKDRFASASEMLAATEAVVRRAYPSAGQTEMEHWLAALAEKDGALPIGRSSDGPSIGGEPTAQSISELTGSSILSARSTPAKTQRRRGPLIALALLGAAIAAAMFLVGPSGATRTEPVGVAPVKSSESPASGGAIETSPAVTLVPSSAVSSAEASASSAELGGAGAESSNEVSVVQEGDSAVGRTQAPPSPPQKRYETMSVLVTSDPSEATVKVGNRTLGTTPIHLRFRVDSIFELSFSKAGYAATPQRIAVTQRKNQKIHVFLKKRSPAHGSGKRP